MREIATDQLVAVKLIQRPIPKAIIPEHVFREIKVRGQSRGLIHKLMPYVLQVYGLWWPYWQWHIRSGEWYQPTSNYLEYWYWVLSRTDWTLVSAQYCRPDVSPWHMLLWSLSKLINNRFCKVCKSEICSLELLKQSSIAICMRDTETERVTRSRFWGQEARCCQS